MSQFSNDLKVLTKKLNSNQLSKENIEEMITLAGDKISEFQLYSLALKYYSFLERNRDFEELDEEDIHNHLTKGHVHDENCNHDYDTEEHVHDENCNHNHDTEEHVHDENCNHDHDTEEHVHDEHCNHDHNTEIHIHDENCNHNHDTEGHIHDEHCNHESSITCDTLEELGETFGDLVRKFSETGLVPTVNELLEVREGLKEHVTVLTAYGDQISFLENVYYKSRYSDEQMMVMDTDEGFAKRVVDILMANEQSSEIREHLKIIYPELPMRMTKGKFFSFIDEYFNKLKGIPTEDVKSHVQLLKETFAPTFVEGYGKIGKEIKEELEKVQETLINGDKGEKDSAYHHMYHLTEDKNEILEKGLDLAELLNHLLALALINFEEEGSRVYAVIKPLLKGESSELVLGEIFEDVEANYEPLGEELIRVSSLIDGLSEHKDAVEKAGLDFEFSELRYAYELTKEGYFIERPFNKDESVPGYSELAMIKHELTGFMDEVMSGESRALKRGRMSLMMGIFQIVHSTGQEIYDHIYQSMSSCDINGEKVMSMQNIYSYLNDFID